MRSYPSWIAGLKFPAPDGTDRGAYCAGLTEGSSLNMVPEPTNKFDSHAVALHHNGKHLGYIPPKARLGRRSYRRRQGTSVHRD